MKRFNKIYLVLILAFVFMMPVLSGCDLFKGKENNKTIETVEISGAIKTEYVLNEEFDSNEAKLLIRYSDESTKEVKITKDMTDFDSSTIGGKTLTITYSEKTVTKPYRVDNFRLGVKYTYRYEGSASNYSLENENENENFYIKLDKENTGVMVATSSIEFTWEYDLDNNIVITTIVNDLHYTLVPVTANIIRMDAGNGDRIILFKCA